MNISYDKEFDVLYINIGNMDNAVGCEEENGIVIFRDLKSQEVRGITVFGVRQKFIEG